jgi:P-type Ca2+ transporter type 2A
MEASWTKSPQATLEYFGVDTIGGLTADQAAKHAELYGKNGL